MTEEAITLDGIVVNVGPFSGDLTRGRLDFERAVQGLENAKEFLDEFELSLKNNTGVDKLNFPKGKKPVKSEFSLGEVDFDITSRKGTKTPAYKSVVDQMQQRLYIFAYDISEDAKFPFIKQIGTDIFISVEKLIDEFILIYSGAHVPNVNYKISYSPRRELADTDLDEITLGDSENYAALTPENAWSYVLLKAVVPNLEAYSKAYKDKLSEGQEEDERTTQVTKKKAYITSKTKPRGPDWFFVVRTLMGMLKDEDPDGELYELADPDVPFAQRQRDYPEYGLRRIKLGDQTLDSVSLRAVYNRIEALMIESMKQHDRIDVTPKDVV